MWNRAYGLGGPACLPAFLLTILSETIRPSFSLENWHFLHLIHLFALGTPVFTWLQLAVHSQQVPEFSKYPDFVVADIVRHLRFVSSQSSVLFLGKSACSERRRSIHVEKSIKEKLRWKPVAFKFLVWCGICLVACMCNFRSISSYFYSDHAINVFLEFFDYFLHKFKLNFYKFWSE